MNFFRRNSDQIKNCESCQEEFSIVAIRNKCSRCERTMCLDCTAGDRKLAMILEGNKNKKERQCVICEKERKFQLKFAEEKKTKWGTLSTVGQKWLETCLDRLDTVKEPDESYQMYLEKSRDPEIKTNDFKTINKDVIEGRTQQGCFNYSMKDFVVQNQEGINEKDLNEAMSNVLKAYCMKLPSIGYTQGMNYVSAYLLTLMDEESAFWVLCEVVAKILPHNFYTSPKQCVPLMGYQQEKFIVMELARDILKLDDHLNAKVQSFMEINGPTLLIPLMINYVNFQVLYNVWNEMILSHSLNIFRKVIIKVIDLLLPQIEDKPMINPPDAQLFITRNLTAQEFSAAKAYEISENRVKELEEQFKTNYSQQWMSNETYIYYTLQKATHFSKAEIVELQKEFIKYVKVDQDGDRSMKKMNGIDISGFKQIIIEVMSSHEDRKEYLNSFNLDQMFEVFDADKTGVLDFKEFICCISILTRGSLEERIQFAFQVFDKDEKGYLTPEEYKYFLKCIVQSSMISNKGTTNPYFGRDLKDFEDKMYLLLESHETITFLDVKKELTNSEFAKICDMSKSMEERRGTIAQITKSLNEAPKGLDKHVLAHLQDFFDNQIVEEDEEDESDTSFTSEGGNEKRAGNGKSLRSSQIADQESRDPDNKLRSSTARSSKILIDDEEAEYDIHNRPEVGIMTSIDERERVKTWTPEQRRKLMEQHVEEKGDFCKACSIF